MSGKGSKSKVYRGDSDRVIWARRPGGRSNSCNPAIGLRSRRGSIAGDGTPPVLDPAPERTRKGVPDNTTVQPSAVPIDRRHSSFLLTDTLARDATVRPTTASTQPPTRTFTATATQVAPSTADSATAARPLPPPLLSAPSVSTVELARRVEQSFHSHPLAPTDAILDDVRRSFADIVPASEMRSTNLAIDFGAELLRLTADRLPRELQARFADISHLDHNMTAATLRYIFEELDIWRRRPERPPSSASYNLL